MNQTREQTRKLNEPSLSILKLGSSARKQAREQARAYSFKTEPSQAYLILGSTQLDYTPTVTPTQKFGISPRVSYTLTEIRDTSPGLLHPHRNLGSLPGSLTPTQKFRISPRVSYTHTEIRDISPGLLHPHRTFRILPRVSFTLTPGFSP